MKIIIVPIFKVIYWVLIICVGIIYSIVYFIYNPKGLINEKKKEVQYHGGVNHKYLGIDWRRTLSNEDFWCPYIIS